MPPALVTFTPGPAPVILTCGHDGGEAPEGLPPRTPYLGAGVFFPSFSIQRDVRTGELTAAIAERLGKNGVGRPTTVVTAVSRRLVDVNRERLFAYDHRAASPYYTAYHRAIIQAVRKAGGRALLLDLHGTSYRSADLFLGTAYGSTVANPAVESTFANLLRQAGYRVAFDHPRLSGGWTVVVHSALTAGLDAIQVEVSRPLREDTRLLALADHLAAVIAVVSQGYLPKKA